MRYRVGALTLVTLLALVVSGCRRAGSEPEAFVWTEQLAPGSVLHLRTGTGGITVTAVPGSTARVTANRVWHKGRSRDINFQVTRAGDQNDIYVCAMWRASGAASYSYVLSRSCFCLVEVTQPSGLRFGTNPLVRAQNAGCAYMRGS